MRVKSILAWAALAALLVGAVHTVASANRGRADRTVRVATFNAFLNRGSAGELLEDLRDPSNAQIRAVAEIIQRSRPDVLLLNEFDFDPTGEALRLFQRNFLWRSQNGAKPIWYPFTFNRPSNTGVPAELDFNNDGSVGGPGDAFGFGFFEGQFGMALLSRYPIDYRRARTFQTFRWADMPEALLPADPEDRDGNGDVDNWFTTDELDAFRLSSKSHWDVPVWFGGKRVHILAAHPTPPVFDGPEDLNGRRNHDEIRFWVDYVTEGRGDYIYDDRGRQGGLSPHASFVIVGDYNADPLDGDSTMGAATQLIANTNIADPKQGAIGGEEDADLEGRANDLQRAQAFLDTADFNPAGPGNLRVDYALPSSDLQVDMSGPLPCGGCRGVFWPASDDPLRYLVGDGFPVVSSDHHLVWVDLRVSRRR